MRFWYFVCSSAVLILLVPAVQKKWKRQLSAKARYALWLIPMIRLLVPFGMVELPVGNMLTFPYAAFEWAAGALPDGTSGAWVRDGQQEPEETGPAGEAAGMQEDGETAAVHGAGEVPAAQPAADSGTAPNDVVQRAQTAGRTGKRSTVSVLGIVWLAGSLVLGVYVLRSNWKLWKTTSTRCQKVRDGRLSVYVGEISGTPCLFGLLHPRILMDRSVWEDEWLRRYALWHEAEHYRQKDHIWVFMRTLLCVIYWWNPFVWLGAVRAREDAELACDEGVLRGCTEQEKKEYGMALLRLLEIAEKKIVPMCGATAMSGNRKCMRRRMEAIVDMPVTRTVPFAASFLLLTTALLVGCTALPAVVRMRAEANPDKASPYTLEAEYQMELPERAPDRLLYFEVYEYGERTGVYKISYRDLEELEAAGEDTGLSIRFGMQWDLGLWNYLEITEGSPADRETFYFPPLEGNLGFAGSILWDDGDLHRVENEKSLILAAEFHNTGNMVVSYGCEYLSETPREEWREYFGEIARVVLVRMVLTERTEEEMTQAYALQEYEQSVPELEQDAIGTFAERWAEAFTSRDGGAIRGMAAESVQKDMEAAGLLDSDMPEVFGQSSPWPWGGSENQKNYEILEAGESGVTILYYALDSTPHVTVWREQLSLVYVNGRYQVIGETLDYMDDISVTGEYHRAYPDGAVSGTAMDYETNGLGYYLNRNAQEAPDSEVYRPLYDPAEAARSLLNLSDNVETQVIYGEGDEEADVRVTFTDAGSLDIRMIRPWGTDGIWIPSTGSFVNL